MTRYLLTIVVSLCLGPVAPAGPAPEYRFVTDPDWDGAALLDGETWVGMGSGFTLRLQQIDEQQRRAFIRKTTGAATDPFASRPDAAPRFLTFVMQLENNGAGTLVFRSQQAWLVTDRNEYMHPIGMETLRGSYGVMGETMSPAYERVGAAFVPMSRNLEPGEALAGLLVYRTFKPTTRRYRLDIQITTPHGDVSTVTAAYKREKIKKTPREKDHR